MFEKIYSDERRALAKKFRQLYHKINRRLKTIEKHLGSSDTINKFRQESFSIAGLQEQAIEEKIKMLEHYDSLKTSFLKGEMNKQNFLERFTQTKLDGETVNSLYNKLVEENKLVSDYKYKVLEELEIMVEDKDSIKTIRDEILDLVSQWNIEDAKQLDWPEDAIKF